MNKLSKKAFDAAIANIKHFGRDLEQALAEYHFIKKNPFELISVLKLYQNQDGGFGHGLEADFQMPLSSPMATSVALRIIQEANVKEFCTGMIRDSIHYLEKTYSSARKGWYAVSNEVNNYPHASWWNYNSKYNQTMIDENWGNPSAEIISYLYEYRQFTNTLEIDNLLKYSISYLHEKTEFTSQYEVYCYIRLYHIVPDSYKKQIKQKLTQAVSQVLSVDCGEWEQFVPYPLRIVTSPECELFQIDSSLLEQNMLFLIDQLETDGMIIPKWHWADCKDVPCVIDWNMDKNCSGWDKAKNDWIGVLTFDTLKTLYAYNVIELH